MATEAGEAGDALAVTDGRSNAAESPAAPTRDRRLMVPLIGRTTCDLKAPGVASPHNELKHLGRRPLASSP